MAISEAADEKPREALCVGVSVGGVYVGGFTVAFTVSAALHFHFVI